MRVCVRSLATDLQEPPATAAAPPPPPPPTPSNSQQQLSALKLLSLTLKISLKLSKTFNGDGRPGGKEAAGAGRARGGVDKATINVKRCWLLALFARSLPRLPVSLSLSAVGACQTKQTKSRKRTTERERKRERKREQQKTVAYFAAPSDANVR